MLAHLEKGSFLRSSEPSLTNARGADLRAERRLVTVMFADISGFTAFAEKSDPEVARDLINACFERFAPIIEKYGGTVDKFIGDAVMALFGAPTAHENDAERALRTAMEMMEALGTINAEQWTDLGLHFGSNTGLVIAGGIGTRARQEYSVMGDAVNLAARLEGLSERGEILVGHDTWRLVNALFDFCDPKPVCLKGKSEPVPVYRLLRAKLATGRVRGMTGLDSPMVGRKAELAAIGRALGRLARGVGGIVRLVGEAGMGKTRLLAEARRMRNHERPPEPVEGSIVRDAPQTSRVWIDGHSMLHGASLPYTLWLDLLRTLLHLLPDAAPAESSRTVLARVTELRVNEPNLVHACIARLMALPLSKEEDLLEEKTGEQAKAATFSAVEELPLAASRRNPLALVCEDLHWADHASLELLERLMPLLERAPILFICVMRPEKERGSWRLREMAAKRYGGKHTDLALMPLSAQETETLIGNLLVSERLPEVLSRRILERAEGNPFYIEEILHSLVDRGAIVRDSATSQWTATDEAENVVIPDTLQGILAARIDRLERGARRILLLASVIGRVFPYRVLASIAGEEQELDACILSLQQQDMIQEWSRAPELEFVFRHHLTQEAAYNGLLKKERRDFHHQVAEALERLFPDRIPENVGVLANHWERAGNPRKAVGYLARAGDAARVALAHTEAVDYYQRALRFLKAQGKFDEAARTLMKLGLAFHNAFDFHRSREAYEEGFALWQLAAREPVVHPAPAPHALRITEGEPRSADPTRVLEVYSSLLQEQLFSTLLGTSPDMGIVPGVAQSWETLAGGRIYVFHLREDVRWSDDVPVSAGDFEFAWKRLLDPASKSPVAQMLFDIRGARDYAFGKTRDPSRVGVRARDARTLVVELQQPVGYFLQLLTVSVTSPVPRHVIEQFGDAWTEPAHLVTNGPFRIALWNRGRRLELERNPSYHGRFAGNLQRVEWSFSTEAAESLLRYHAGDTDVLNIFRWSPSQMRRAGEQYAREYFRAPLLSTLLLVMNQDHAPFDDTRVRRALALAVDKSAMSDVALEGCMLPGTGGVIPPGLPGHSEKIGLPFNPAEARRLLAEAGYPGGGGFPSVDALCADTPIGGALGRHLRAELERELGIAVEWKPMSPNEFFRRIHTKEAPPLYFINCIASFPDPHDFLTGMVMQFHSGPRNRSVEDLLARAVVTADQQQRMRLYQQADRILIEQAVLLPLGYGRSHSLVKP